MTLAQRFAVAIGIVTVVTTVALSFGVREAWRRTEAESFRNQFLGAVERLGDVLATQSVDLQREVEPLCTDDPFVDSVLVDLRTGAIRERRLSISQLVPKLMKGRSLDELVLLTGQGEVLGAGDPGLVGSRRPKLAARIAGPQKKAVLRSSDGPLALEAFCTRSEQDASVSVYAARHVDELLTTVAAGSGLTLSLSEPSTSPDAMVHVVELAELGGVAVYATQSRIPLRRALRKLDTTVLVIGVGTFGLALVFALLLSRGLARPIERLAAQVREVVAGEPKPVKGSGGRELVELSVAFNKTISDLTIMRKRLAATERIAARREIARRVAHEIKNPLAPIQASVETLRRLRARDDPRFDEYFDEATRTVLEEVARIANIVTEFTRFARLPPPNPASLDLVEVARKVVGLHAEGAAKVTLDVSQCPTIRADADQMVQVLTNLVQNAIDAAAQSDEPEVVVSVQPEGRDHVSVRVRDNGPGVSPEMRDQLFEPYATTKPAGTGLGLAIVHRIVVEHAGEISYADAPAGGAEFTIVMPISGPSLLPQAPTSTPLTGGEMAN